MSATILKDRTLGVIVDLLNENARQMLNLQFRPAQQAIANAGQANQTSIGVLPAVTAEQLGLQAAELNAERRALMQAASVIEEQHKILVAPEEKPDALVQPNGNGAAEPRPEPIY